MKQNESKNARERAKAARRAAQLRREAEERVEAEAKLESGEPLETNDVLAMMGSALRVPVLSNAEEMELVQSGITDEDLFGAFGDDATDALEAMASAEQSTPKRRKRAAGYSFTADAISALRDVQGLSWRQVATNLDLANPGQARKAYAELTGKDYHATETTTRTKAVGLTGTVRKFFSPQWDDESDQDEIIERLTRAVIVVQRTLKGTDFQEEIKVGTVTRLTWDGSAEELCVHFTDYDNGGQRSILVKNIKEVR